MNHLFRMSFVIAALAAMSTCFAKGLNMAGTWVVYKNGKANPNMKLVFTPKGEFKFVGANYSSSGNYSVTGNGVRLLWTKVDNQKVKLGSMKKELTVSPEQTFTIDQYTYGRAR
jgi:hypothetical protein